MSNRRGPDWGALFLLLYLAWATMALARWIANA